MQKKNIASIPKYFGIRCLSNEQFFLTVYGFMVFWGPPLKRFFLGPPLNKCFGDPPQKKFLGTPQNKSFFGGCCDMWHVTHGGGWTISQNVSSPALQVWNKRCLEDSELKHHSMNEWMNESESDWDDCKTAYTGSVNYYVFQICFKARYRLIHLCGNPPSLHLSTNCFPCYFLALP